MFVHVCMCVMICMDVYACVYALIGMCVYWRWISTFQFSCFLYHNGVLICLNDIMLLYAYVCARVYVCDDMYGCVSLRIGMCVYLCGFFPFAHFSNFEFPWWRWMTWWWCKHMYAHACINLHRHASSEEIKIDRHQENQKCKERRKSIHTQTYIHAYPLMYEHVCMHALIFVCVCSFVENLLSNVEFS